MILDINVLLIYKHCRKGKTNKIAPHSVYVTTFFLDFPFEMKVYYFSNTNGTCTELDIVIPLKLELVKGST